jgi:probable phosphoglycerate mutase
MHGRAIRIFLATLLNYELKSMEDFAHNNLGLYLINYSDSKFEIEKSNDVEHLSALE